MTASSPTSLSARPAYHGAPPGRGGSPATMSRERCPITPSGRTDRFDLRSRYQAISGPGGYRAAKQLEPAVSRATVPRTEARRATRGKERHAATRARPLERPFTARGVERSELLRVLRSPLGCSRDRAALAPRVETAAHPRVQPERAGGKVALAARASLLRDHA